MIDDDLNDDYPDQDLVDRMWESVGECEECGAYLFDGDDPYLCERCGG